MRCCNCSFCLKSEGMVNQWMHPWFLHFDIAKDCTIRDIVWLFHISMLHVSYRLYGKCHKNVRISLLFIAGITSVSGELQLIKLLFLFSQQMLLWFSSSAGEYVRIQTLIYFYQHWFHGLLLINSAWNIEEMWLRRGNSQHFTDGEI